MNKKLMFVSILAVFAIAIFAVHASAYGYYGNDYKNEYYQKTSYGYYGQEYVEKQTTSDPWGEKVTYTKITDRDGYGYYPYRNRVNNYWDYGPYGNDYGSPRYLGYSWDDSWRRRVDGSQYHTYYYQPSQYYNGVYYNWHGN